MHVWCYSRLCQDFFGENMDVKQEIILCHIWLGHPSFFYLKKLHPSLLSFPKIEFESLFCDACEYAKHTRNSYSLSDNKNTTHFSTIHGVLLKTVSLSSSWWFVTFIGCCIKMTWVSLLKAKGEGFSYFQSFHKMIWT